MGDLNKIFTEDITSKTTFFYPCSGMDIKSIKDLLDYKNNNLQIDNFVLVDLNMDYDLEINDLEIQENRVLYRQDFFFDNILGLNRIEIIKKKKYGLKQIKNFVGKQLKSYIKNTRFNDLVRRVIKPKAIRYILKYKSHEFVLYLIHYEATIISEKIRLTENNNAAFGLILQRHIDGAFSDESFFINKMIEINPDYLVSPYHNDYSKFKDYKVLDEQKFIYYRNHIEKSGGINFIKIR